MSPSVEPFDEDKYKALMDGLECSEINKKYIEKKTYDFRIESEFFKKKDLALLSKLGRLNVMMLENGLVETVTDGTHFTPTYIDEGIPFLSAINVKENCFNPTAGYKFISKEEHFQLCKRVHPKHGDILLRKVGVGPRWACVVPYNAFDFSIFVSVALIRSKINPYYLATYLNSKYGQLQLLRFNKGISQPDLHLEDIRKTIVPIFSDRFYSTIEYAVRKAEQSFIKSFEKSDEAEMHFEQILHIKRIEMLNTAVSVKQLSESLKSMGRLDAEYYQPKYDILFGELKKFSCIRLGGPNGIVNIKKSIEPGSDAYEEEGIPFVRVSDVSKYGITPTETYLSHDVVENVETLFPKKNTILFSKDGSVGIAYKLERDEDIITSGALLHLTVKNTSEVLPDYLTLVLNSPVVQMQAERDSNGATIQHWKPSEIENVIIPVLDMDKQKELAEMVQKSFELRCHSKQLLEYAKQAVEMAIEQSEDAALAWLSGKVPNVEV